MSYKYNPYNYPALSKKDTMNLDVIRSSDESLKKFKSLDTKRDFSLNLFNLDIDKSTPNKNFFLFKPDFTNHNEDIEGTKCLNHFNRFTNKRQDFCLNISDIDKAKPQHSQFITNRKPFNPLEPEYPQQKSSPPFSNQQSLEMNKFIRDNINVDDIEGTKPKQIKQNIVSNYVKEDIPGTHPKFVKARKEQYAHKYLNYSDLNQKKSFTKRSVNPLSPVYLLDYGNNEKFVYGDIEGNKPNAFNKYINRDPFNLNNRDIDGTQAGSLNKMNQYTSNDYNLRVDDINTKKKFLLHKSAGIKPSAIGNESKINKRYESSKTELQANRYKDNNSPSPSYNKSENNKNSSYEFNKIFKPEGSNNQMNNFNINRYEGHLFIPDQIRQSYPTPIPISIKKDFNFKKNDLFSAKVSQETKEMVKYFNNIKPANRIKDNNIFKYE